MSRAVIRTTEWTLTLDPSPELPRAEFTAECADCGARSLTARDEPLSVEVWTIKHTGLNPSHRRFTLRIEQRWVVEPAPGNPYHDSAG
ncbi:hypothetical protein [Streptomyces aidingensis]|uniref:DUF7848 domain-containing protein n=1 Tax=Streptomyces aidingensis TaxID=910347 RepID=A0A1I1ESB1_9ACTN|nr:hypothetical protein [Streptomyces aidingensis]SFB87800.1 hypothetical protein SAMN05421773_101355 [Streptomyces aidingensis]